MAAKPGHLTIRGGRLRGKKIPIPADGVRPTSDRMREQIFNLLAQHFRLPDGRARLGGARVLDAFAGTGALGLEALSRGAAEVFAWDTSPREARALSNLGLSAAHQSALTPPQTTRAVDLVFLDPPYGKGLLAQALSALTAAGWVGPDTLIVAEAERGLPTPPLMHVLVHRSVGQSALWLLKPEDQTAS